ncbi:MAG: PSD1 domain-containing protein [Planctomycetes bacterium]|nr:PSD1 domain-containing protein [Planctomycetota bacterium]
MLRIMKLGVIALATTWVTAPFAGAADPAPRKLPAAVTRKIDFAADVKPILQRSCIKCHANGKRKGGFNIDHIHTFLGGGDSGPAVVPGKSAESPLIELLLSNDPDERMPAKGDPLTLEEIAILRAWIDQGVKWEKGFTFAKFRNAPLAPRKVDLPPGPEANPVDRLLARYYKQHHVKADATVSDAVFVRRVFLDTIGLLPTSVELEAFRADKRSDKRARLVAELLADKQNYSEHWVTFWSDCLRNSYSRQYHGGGGKQITGWLKKSLAENKPYDQFVRELIDPVAGSDGFIKGVAWRGTVNASQVTEMQAAQNVAQVFLGLNIKCASCHDSFINDWKLKQTYALASIFAEQPMQVHRCNKPIGEKARPAFLYPELGTIDPAAPRAQRVKQLSVIMTSPKNGRLARTVVNRLWAIFFGRGLVEPVDEMDNPAWNQDLLDWLAVDLVNQGYDLKHTMRLLLTSKAYQRPSVPLDPDADEYVFQGPAVRRMSAEQFLDGLDQIILAAKGKVKARSTGRQRAGLRNLDRLMRTLGRPKRDVVVTRRESIATTAQLIELSNGKPLADLMARGGKAWLESGHQTDAIVNALFVNALGRNPSARERQSARDVAGSPASAQGIEDLLWILAMHPEFQLIH